MNWKSIERITAGFVFAWSLVLYLLTVAPTTSFWDSGEFIASVYKLQVMHPPGAPFYMLVGRFFSMLAPSAETVAYAVNLISVLASAGTVFFTHLIIVRLVKRWQGENPGTGERIIALVSGVVGALTFAATDSFWFNAVEAEVYAFSMFFTAAVVWLVMHWSVLAEREEKQLKGGRHAFGLSANRYLVLIAYFFGLAIGVHLLNLLAFFFIALIVYFTEFDRDDLDTSTRWWGIVLTGAVSIAIFFSIYPGIILGIPELFETTGAPMLTVVGLSGLVAYGIYYTHTRDRKAMNLAFVCVAMVLIGYSTYALIFIRSNTEPHIDLNDPDTVQSFISYLQREQYGSTPLLKGVTYDDARGRVPTARNAEESFFPRRYSSRPQHERVYARYNSDLDFFVSYQINHMYMRYFFWNFVGKASDVQDSGAITGIPFVDSLIERDPPVLETPSEKSSRNAYFALPLLLGLFGMFYHFNRDWRRAFSVFILFFVTGIGIIIYLNQTPMQPRERDYSYVASFFAFSLWVGIGAGGLVRIAYELMQEKAASVAQSAVLLGVGLLTFAGVPGWMTLENYDDHDRSGRYVARDYAFNMLNSVEQDGILFTNGDNDTYPLWYLQEVEGVRTDVRVVNLSLLNTPWYVEQMKEEAAYDSDPVPISLSDSQIQDLRPQLYQPQTVQLPVNRNAVERTSEVYLPEPSRDSLRIQSPMQWRLEGRPFDQQSNMLQAADLVAYNILRTNAEDSWRRPIYFAVTVSSSGQLGLENYFQHEGQAQRVVPIPHDKPFGRVVPGLTEKRMTSFRFTNLDDPDVYYDETARNMVDGYRLQFSQAAQQFAERGMRTTGSELLNRISSEVPFTTIPSRPQTYFFVAQAFSSLGEPDMAAETMQQAEGTVLRELRRSGSRQGFSFALQMAGMVRSAYLDAGKQDRVRTFDAKIDRILANSEFVVPDELRRQFGLAGKGDTSGTTLPPALMPQQQEQPSPSDPSAPSGNAPSAPAPSGSNPGQNQ